MELQITALQGKVVEIAGEQAITAADAQQKASEAANQRAQASAARVQAAQAALDAKVARLAAAKARATEASHIRDSLSLPPLHLDSVDAVANTMAGDRLAHSEALESGLLASRELIRLLRSAGIPSTNWPRPDLGVGNAPPAQTWSAALKKELEDLKNSFEGSTGPSSKNVRIIITLTPDQIKSLTSPAGLKVFLRPIPEGNANPAIPLSDGMNVGRNIPTPSGRNGRVIAFLFSGTGKDQGNQVVKLDSQYNATGEHRGDRWIAYQDVHLVDPRPVANARMLFMDPGNDPVQFVINQVALSKDQGDPNFFNIVGTPTSGTSVLRLQKINPIPIQSLDLVILHSFYD